MIDICEADPDRLGARERLRRGGFAEFARNASACERRLLRSDVCDIAHPVVFGQLTRKLEIKRGHQRCATSMFFLQDDCLDRFHDDVDAAVADVFEHATEPIHNPEGWVGKRLRAVTVDAHRRRRGERGAMQRPRMPRWLAARLDDEPRLIALAIRMLEFAGVETTAGTEVWPIDTWTAERAVADGDYDAARRAVLCDIDTVVTAMRGRPAWYADYIERPLGRKRAPLLAVDNPDPARDLAACRAASDDAAEAHLIVLAATTIAAIEIRLAKGEEPRTVVVDVLRTVFGTGTGVESLDHAPGDTVDPHEWVVSRLADEATVNQLAITVLRILGEQG